MRPRPSAHLARRVPDAKEAAGQEPAAFSDATPMPVPASKSRIERLETQVDTISEQLDRIVDARAFLSRVLTDRIDQLPDPRLRTPH